jgi:hypothetical protein
VVKNIELYIKFVFAHLMGLTTAKYRQHALAKPSHIPIKLYGLTPHKTLISTFAVNTSNVTFSLILLHAYRKALQS